MIFLCVVFEPFFYLHSYIDICLIQTKNKTNSNFFFLHYTQKMGVVSSVLCCSGWQAVKETDMDRMRSTVCVKTAKGVEIKEAEIKRLQDQIGRQVEQLEEIMESWRTKHISKEIAQIRAKACLTTKASLVNRLAQAYTELNTAQLGRVESLAIIDGADYTTNMNDVAQVIKIWDVPSYNKFQEKVLRKFEAVERVAEQQQQLNEGIADIQQKNVNVYSNETIANELDALFANDGVLTANKPNENKRQINEHEQEQEQEKEKYEEINIKKHHEGTFPLIFQSSKQRHKKNNDDDSDQGSSLLLLAPNVPKTRPLHTAIQMTDSW